VEQDTNIVLLDGPSGYRGTMSYQCCLCDHCNSIDKTCKVFGMIPPKYWEHKEICKHYADSTGEENPLLGSLWENNRHKEIPRPKQ